MSAMELLRKDGPGRPESGFMRPRGWLDGVGEGRPPGAVPAGVIARVALSSRQRDPKLTGDATKVPAYSQDSGNGRRRVE